ESEPAGNGLCQQRVAADGVAGCDDPIHALRTVLARPFEKGGHRIGNASLNRSRNMAGGEVVGRHMMKGSANLRTLPGSAEERFTAQTVSVVWCSADRRFQTAIDF